MNSIPETARTVVLLSRDLIFNTKIRAVTSARGAELKVARSAEQLRELLTGGVDMLVLDLHTQQPSLEEVRELLSAHNATFEVLGYYSHVDRDTAARARSLGFEQIIPRSKFIPVFENALS